MLKLTVSTASGEFDYRFFQPQPNGDFLVTRNGQDGYFKLAAYIAEPLVKDKDDLTVAAPPAAAQPRRSRPRRRVDRNTQRHNRR